MSSAPYEQTAGERFFVLESGKALNTIKDLHDEVDQMSEELFVAHQERGDFSNWIEAVFGQGDLAASLRGIKGRASFKKRIGEWMASFDKPKEAPKPKAAAKPKPKAAPKPKPEPETPKETAKPPASEEAKVPERKVPESSASPSSSSETSSDMHAVFGIEEPKKKSKRSLFKRKAKKKAKEQTLQAEEDKRSEQDVEPQVKQDSDHPFHDLWDEHLQGHEHHEHHKIKVSDVHHNQLVHEIVSFLLGAVIGGAIAMVVTLRLV